MEAITIEVPNSSIKEKVLWFLNHLQSDGVKVVEEKKVEKLDLFEDFDKITSEDDNLMRRFAK